MTPKSLLIAALAVGILLLHGTGAAPGMANMAPQEVTDEDLAALDKLLEDATVEDIQNYLKKQRLDAMDYLEDNRDNMKQAVDEFVDRALAQLAKEPTAEEIAVLEKELANFNAAAVKEYLAKGKLAMDKLKSVMEEVAAIFPAQPAPQ